ncbi:MAG: SAM-dependent methyltransferase [Actinomycetota bacterium]|nr:SAM-dependent methyltransferase [Actinomycetota bacterium]
MRSHSARTLVFIVCKFALYGLSVTDVDVLGLAYQQLVRSNLLGDRKKYFTPRSTMRLIVDILDPGEHENVLDPTGAPHDHDCLVVMTDRESPRPRIRSFQPRRVASGSPHHPGSWRRGPDGVRAKRRRRFGLAERS